MSSKDGAAEVTLLLQRAALVVCLHRRGAQRAAVLQPRRRGEGHVEPLPESKTPPGPGQPHEPAVSRHCSDLSQSSGPKLRRVLLVEEPGRRTGTP